MLRASKVFFALIAGAALAMSVDSSSVAQQVGWVAIAVNPAGHVGMAYGRPTRELARDTALGGCGHSDCRIEAIVQARCVSYVYATSPRAYGYSYGADATVVETQAFRNCRSAAGNACKLHRTLCHP